MPAPQLVHVEDVLIGARVYTICVARVAGGLAGQWHCSCGECMAPAGTHLTIDDALRQAKQAVELHHQLLHAAEAKH